MTNCRTTVMGCLATAGLMWACLDRLPEPKAVNEANVRRLLEAAQEPTIVDFPESVASGWAVGGIGKEAKKYGPVRSYQIHEFGTGKEPDTLTIKGIVNRNERSFWFRTTAYAGKPIHEYEEFADPKHPAAEAARRYRVLRGPDSPHEGTEG